MSKQISDKKPADNKSINGPKIILKIIFQLAKAWFVSVFFSEILNCQSGWSVTSDFGMKLFGPVYGPE